MSRRGPPECPNCGYDPEGDSEDLKSGGGWIYETSIEYGVNGLVQIDELRCSICQHIIFRDETNAEPGGPR